MLMVRFWEAVGRPLRIKPNPKYKPKEKPEGEEAEEEEDDDEDEEAQCLITEPPGKLGDLVECPSKTMSEFLR